LPQQEWKKAGESVACDDRKQRDDKKDMANAVVKCRAFEHDEANGQQGCSPDDQRLPGYDAFGTVPRAAIQATHPPDRLHGSRGGRQVLDLDPVSHAPALRTVL
jgi:hypothetical protein